MEMPVNKRVLLLKSQLGLSNSEFALKANISTTTLWNIQNNGEIAPKTIKNISEALKVNREWLLTGKGEMNAPEQPKQAVGQENTFDGALEKLRNLFEDQLKKKDEQIAGLLSVLQKVNFLEALPIPGRGAKIPRTVRAAA